MITDEIRDTLRAAGDQLELAGRELNRPEEHVVTFSVCKNTQQTMQNMMAGYLSAHGITADPGSSLESLYEQCRSVNPDFIRADIAGIACKDMDQNHVKDQYCLAVGNVDCCTNVARAMKEIIWDELKID